MCLNPRSIYGKIAVVVGVLVTAAIAASALSSGIAEPSDDVSAMGVAAVVAGVAIYLARTIYELLLERRYEKSPRGAVVELGLPTTQTIDRLKYDHEAMSQEIAKLTSMVEGLRRAQDRWRCPYSTKGRTVDEED